MNCCYDIQTTTKSALCQSIYQCFQLKLKKKGYTFLYEFINDTFEKCSWLEEVSFNMN